MKVEIGDNKIISKPTDNITVKIKIISIKNNEKDDTQWIKMQTQLAETSLNMYFNKHCKAHNIQSNYVKIKIKNNYNNTTK